MTTVREDALALCDYIESRQPEIPFTVTAKARALRARLAAEPDREALAREIALHVVTIGEGYDGRDCSCGARWPETDMGTLAKWRAWHLADVVLSAPAGRHIHRDPPKGRRKAPAEKPAA